MQYDEDYFNSEEFKELLDSYEAAQQAGEQPFMDADDLVDLADYYNYRGEFDKADQAIDHALELFPDATLPNVYKARQALAADDDKGAHRYADAIGDKEDPDYVYLKAEILIAERHADEADRYLRQMAKTVEEDEWEDFIKDCANLFVDYGINDKAYEWMMRSKGDDSSDFKELMARTLFGLGKYEDSERLFNELIDRNPYSTHYWNALASVQLMNEDYSNAITSSEYAIAINPENPEGLAYKANGLFRLGNYEEALEYFRRLNKIVPDDDLALLNIGVCLVNLNRQQEAIPYLENALEMAEETSETLQQIYLELAFCYSTQHQLAKALEMIDTAMQLPGDTTDLLVIRGHLLLENGMAAEAEESFKKAIKQSDMNPAILLRIIVSLYDNRYVQSSYHMFKKFFQVVNVLDPDFNKGYAYMALCCYDLKKWDEFMDYLRQSVEQNPREARIVLGFLFPQGMEPADYVSYMEQHLPENEKTK
jgi:tetratricopeptide (TPR) repeat protein